MSRDLVGYGANRPEIIWPDGNRLAVSIVVNFEEGAEEQVGDGDSRSERIGEVLSVVEPGRPDPGQEQIFAYGMRAGVWRMAECLDGYDIPATIFFCGRAVQRAPDIAAMLVQRGHEAACHGWTWKAHANYSCEEEEALDLDRATAAIESVTGKRPIGFFCRGGESPWTRKLISERGYKYTSNGFDDDLPYEDTSVPHPLLVVPYALDTNDMKFFHPNGFVRAKEMIEYVTDALDVMQNEASRGKSGLINLGFHLRIVGRPARFKAFQAIVEEVSRRREHLWVATRSEIADAFRKSRGVM
ncbi:polysaccharide deacetylase family protein [Agrobacterium pusense]|uniref:polysaccharide deacetylase family protein n=2 Tax=Agrobacterium pusense TaxID=648995 RepID=UPI0032D9E244